MIDVLLAIKGDVIIVKVWSLISDDYQLIGGGGTNEKVDCVSAVYVIEIITSMCIVVTLL